MADLSVITAWLLGKVLSVLMEMWTATWLLQHKSYELFRRARYFSSWLNASTECGFILVEEQRVYGMPYPQPGHARCFHYTCHTIFPIPTQNIDATPFYK